MSSETGSKTKLSEVLHKHLNNMAEGSAAKTVAFATGITTMAVPLFGNTKIVGAVLGAVDKLVAADALLKTVTGGKHSVFGVAAKKVEEHGHHLDNVVAKIAGVMTKSKTHAAALTGGETVAEAGAPNATHSAPKVQQGRV